MARGSSTKPTDKKAEKKAQKAQALASNALAAFPDSKETRAEFFREREALKKASKSAASTYGDFVKKKMQLWAITPQALKIRDILEACPAGVFEATMQQVQQFMSDTNRPVQFGLFTAKLEPGKGVSADDQGAVFDKSGNRAAPSSSEREHKPKLTGAEPPAHVPSPALPIDEALEKLNGAKTAAEEKRGGRTLEEVKAKTPAPPPRTKPAETKPAATPRPPARTAQADAKPTARRTNRTPTADELAAVRKTADKYVPPKSGDDDDSNDMPGNYRPH